jgi:predicted nuclease with TOPRIM domain
MRLHNYEILQRKMMDRIVELESSRGLSKEQITDKLLFDKEREIEKLRESNRRLYESNFQLRTENDDRAYWVERAEKLQHAYSDLRWRWDNQPVVEKQTARACTEIVNKFKNEPNNPIESQIKKAPHKWWIVCEEIEKAIKKEFDLR